MLSIAALTAVFAAVAVRAQDDVVSSSQYWHERYHGILSMAAYGDYETLCPLQTFNQAALQKSFPDSTEEPWTVIEKWGPTASGLEGFNVIIPEMDKVVQVFKGMYGWEQLNMTSMPINNELNLNCTDCKAHAGAVQAYLEAKEATNDWALVKAYVASTGHQWSITGHGFGGMVAYIAGLDLGWRGLCHWHHSHGAPRTLNPASANLFNSLYAGEAGQRTVANMDIVPTIIPESDDYTHTLQGFHIYGTNSTYGMSFSICDSDPTDPECLGGGSAEDHLFYYTPIGQCGSPNTANATLQDPVESSLSAAFYATATSTYITPSYTPPVESSTSTEIPTPVATAGSNSLGATGAATAAAEQASQSSAPVSGAASVSSRTALVLAAVAGVAGAFVVIA